MDEANAEGRLWRFATRVYARPGVADACLTLQDDDGQDVLLLLFVAWIGAQGRVPTPEQMARADAEAAGWRGEVVQALRAVRRRLKTDPALTSDPAVAALREEVKRAELAAERIALARLERAAAAWTDGGDRADPSSAAEENLHRAFGIGAGRAPDARAAALLGIIGAAACAEPEL